MTLEDLDKVFAEIDMEHAAKRSMVLHLQRTDPSITAADVRARVASIRMVSARIVDPPDDN